MVTAGHCEKYARLLILKWHMKSPRQYVADKFPWLTLTDSLVVAFVLVLAIVAIWPHAHLVGDIVRLPRFPDQQPPLSGA